MARTVLRNNPDNSEITHVLYDTFNGHNIFLTCEDRDRMRRDFTGKDIEKYYTGPKEDEFDSMKEDLESILMESVPLSVIKLNIAKQSGLIKDKVLELPL